VIFPLTMGVAHHWVRICIACHKGVKMQIPCFSMVQGSMTVQWSWKACSVLTSSTARLSQWPRLVQKNATAIAWVSLVEKVSLRWMGHARKTSALAKVVTELRGRIAPQMDRVCVYGVVLGALWCMEFVR